LFTTLLSIDGTPVGEAIIDTGGGYELLLRESFGLPVTGNVDVLAFGGAQSVDVTSGFDYTVGDVSDHADFALVGSSVCGCNGVGFQFFRKTGWVLALDFATMRASFVRTIPPGGAVIPFAAPPDTLASFDTSFVEVTVSTGGVSRSVLALLDTGTNTSVMRRGLLPDGSRLTPHQTEILVAEPQLGTIAVTARLFDTPDLPDLILGTDAMQAWSDHWYFHFAPQGGTVIARPSADSPPDGVAAARRPGAPGSRSSVITRPLN
jgi:hypothetical protein